MKKKLIDLLTLALSSLAQESRKDPSNIKIEIKENTDRKFGDYSTNLAMIASKIFSRGIPMGIFSWNMSDVAASPCIRP